MEKELPKLENQGKLDPSRIQSVTSRFDTFIPNFLSKFLPKDGTICSVGCGTGYDVYLLRKAGYFAYGFDPTYIPGQTFPKQSNTKEEIVKTALLEDRPFREKTFDYVYCLEVIEHVGTRDFDADLLEHAFEIRSKFINDCLDLLKPDGKLLLTTSHRLCPIDIGHGHNYSILTRLFSKKQPSLTLPWHPRNICLSTKDVQNLVNSTKYANSVKIKQLSCSNYPRSSHGPGIKRFFIRLVLNIVGSRLLRNTPLNPILIVEITKSN